MYLIGFCAVEFQKMLWSDWKPTAEFASTHRLYSFVVRPLSIPMQLWSELLGELPSIENPSSALAYATLLTCRLPVELR